MNSRNRLDFDNQLGFIHNMVEPKITKEFTTADEKIVFEEDETSDGEIIKWKNDYLDSNLASRVRNFLNDVQFSKAGLCNDTDNRPKNGIFYDAVKYKIESGTNTSTNVQGKGSESTSSVDNWEWIAYNSQIWRLAPKSLDAFIHSMINELITTMEQKLKNNFPYLQIMNKACWVIQLIKPGSEVNLHRDGQRGESRKFSFIYYLTPDDWDSDSEKGEGGALSVGVASHKGLFYSQHVYRPLFNRIITWDMTYQHSPVHCVEKITGARSRIALVGFFDCEPDIKEQYSWNLRRD